MSENVHKLGCFSALAAMQNRLKAYESKPNADLQYLQKSKMYLQNIENYIEYLENDIVTRKFNADIVIPIDPTGAEQEAAALSAQLNMAQKRIRSLETILETLGVSSHEQRGYIAQERELLRHNSINRAMVTWPELY